MEEFYRNWLALQGYVNPEYGNISNEEDGNNSDDVGQVQEPHSQENLPDNPAGVIYETQELQLIVERGIHKRQQRFNLQDQMFYLKIIPKGNNEMPLLMNILDFLHNGIVYILEEISKHFKPDEHNMAYLTLIQRPMVSGLNTGTNL
ncbi:MAG: hypothetical protein FJ333_05155 [Sphingomonadales bacterium]|nr:hypothetical protein [Sphingomonadales bacterium]